MYEFFAKDGKENVLIEKRIGRILRITCCREDIEHTNNINY